MIDILQKIAAHKKNEVVASQEQMAIEDLMLKPLFDRKCYAVKEAIENNEYGIIAEFKRKSPSKPAIHLEAKPTEVIPSYEANGAAAISVLTDLHFFGGNIEFLSQNRNVQVPLLRKDFIIDAYQIYEAKAYGADFILLIAAILTQKQIIAFTDLAHRLGLEVLLEFHAGEEFEKLYPPVDLVGINNRNLRTFEVNLNHSIAMREKIGEKHLCVAESGIHSVEDYHLLHKNGFNAFLMGEYFMQYANPGEALKQFIHQIKNR